MPKPSIPVPEHSFCFPWGREILPERVPWVDDVWPE
jgi:hypothetical protein